MLEEELSVIEEIYLLKQKFPEWTEKEIVNKILEKE